MKKITTIILAAIAGFSLACTEWAQDSAEQGWGYFEEGDYENARFYFEDALSWDSYYADAYNGLGWCDLLEDDIQSALGNFSQALGQSPDLTDANAGAALAATEEGEHEAALDYADEVIGADAVYQFTHNSSFLNVTIEDVRLAKAKSAVVLGYFDEALAEIQAIDSGFDADPLTSEGKAEILDKIEQLIATYGG